MKGGLSRGNFFPLTDRSGDLKVRLATLFHAQELAILHQLAHQRGDLLVGHRLELFVKVLDVGDGHLLVTLHRIHQAHLDVLVSLLGLGRLLVHSVTLHLLVTQGGQLLAHLSAQGFALDSGVQGNNVGHLLALGVHHIGLKAAKLLANHFDTMDALLSASEEDIKEIDGMGDISAKTLKDTLSLPETISLIEDFKAFGLNMKNLTEKADDRFKGMTFVLTGTLSKFGRREAQEIIEKFGGKASGSVSKKTTYVLAGEDAGSKLRKANELGITVISEAQFDEMIK